MTETNDLILWETKDHVTTLTLNNPRKLNGWTMDMLDALGAALKRAANDADTKVLILTGADPYYCAGVNLSAVISPGHPAKLHAFIVEQNQGLFEMFLNFPKPIMVAVNGPAIGASVTSATLCDAIIASESATFSTPFAKLGVTPEGCSSVLLPKLVGEDAARRMLGPEGWQPTGSEAAEIGLVDQVVAHENLLEEASELAKQWICDGRKRSFKASMSLDELRKINARESQELADAFLGPKFLRGQYEFLKSKGKTGPALVFRSILLSRPLWKRLLPK
ncbi:enoyl-CoA hydratase/isomerase family protein [Microvenator marinus]|uniref:Enoyl-CoA hydratase/isomerase family protein n=1 Tax=Microvenator marinus TaxID=2600177 RepID=A0A5B8XJ42_9DELT|nr:enoyl-CoA hydratase/isomerase family protein [Microvenator marinus]QED25782.1 enoyl-CoA hydratase/isomerase family protein [Microvenator marinus]